MNVVTHLRPTCITITKSWGFPEDWELRRGGFTNNGAETDASGGGGGGGDGVEEEEGQEAKEFWDRRGAPKGHPVPRVFRVCQ